MLDLYCVDGCVRLVLFRLLQEIPQIRLMLFNDDWNVVLGWHHTIY